jgi:hypothetical protein
MEYQRSVMKRGRLPAVITGQIIPVYRPFYTGVAIAATVLSMLLIGGGFSLLAPGLALGVVWLTVLAAVMLFVGVALLPAASYLRTHAPHLIVGEDRVQLWRGKGQPVEVFYDAIARIEVVPCWGPLLLPGRGIGIELREPQAFDADWPRLRAVRERNRRRRGVDVIIPTQLLAESPDRCIDTLLTAYHRYRHAAEEEAPVRDEPAGGGAPP